MDHGERFVRTVQYEQVDRLPIRHAYGLTPGVLEQWHREGLPAQVGSREAITQHFGFPPRVLSEDEDVRIAMDGWGRPRVLSPTCSARVAR